MLKSQSHSAFTCVALVGGLILGSASLAFIQPVLAQTAPAAPAAPLVPKTTTVAPSHLAVAVEVVKASGLMVMIEGATPNVIAGLRANISRQRPELVKEIEESLAIVENAIPKAREDAVANAAALLAEKMTEAELKEISTFLASPAGKKYVTTLPQFVEEVVPLLEGWGQATSEILTQLFQVEMAKRGHKL